MRPKALLFLVLSILGFAITCAILTVHPPAIFMGIPMDFASTKLLYCALGIFGGALSTLFAMLAYQAIHRSPKKTKSSRTTRSPGDTRNILNRLNQNSKACHNGKRPRIFKPTEAMNRRVSDALEKFREVSAQQTQQSDEISLFLISKQNTDGRILLTQAQKDFYETWDDNTDDFAKLLAEQPTLPDEYDNEHEFDVAAQDLETHLIELETVAKACSQAHHTLLASQGASEDLQIHGELAHAP